MSGPEEPALTDPQVGRRVKETRRRLREGDSFGAYVIVRYLGGGGMGEVYEGHDSRLMRPVALKILNGEVWAGAEEEGQQRLTREALVLAKLSHPNIVGVYEIGAVRGERFVAMEYVEGGTVRAWLKAGERGVRDILEVFIQAGRGLAAAHSVGLVHRDFKPDNALIDGDGRVRVSDFGLAEAAGAVVPPSEGTPAYAAPEQKEGRADARSDQYSFCVALREALPPRIPAHARAALARGLAEDPERRFPGMAELIAVLASDPGARRRRLLALAATAVATTAIVLGALRLMGRSEVCSGAQARLAGVWDASARAQMTAAFHATGLGYADDTSARVLRGLDRYFTSWGDMHREVCEATAVRREQSEAVLDLRMGCLERLRLQGRALVSIFTSADAEVVGQAVNAVAGLGPIDACGDIEALQAASPPPDDPAVRARIAVLESDLARSFADRLAGRYQLALDDAAGTVAAARATGHAPLIARALYELGRSQNLLGESRPAEITLREALAFAVRARDDGLVADVWSYISSSLRAQGRLVEAEALWLAYDMAVERAGGQPLQRAAALLERARTESDAGRNAQALRLAEQSRALREAVLGRDHPEVAYSMSYVAHLLAAQGALEEGLAMSRRALEIQEAVYGPHHASVAVAARTLGETLWDLGRLAEADATLARAARLWDEALGADSIPAAHTLVSLAGVEVDEERFDAAQAHLERARATYEKREPGSVAYVLLNLTGALAGQGRPAEARQAAQQAREILVGTVGPHHPMVAEAALALGQVFQDEGKLDEAEHAYRGVLEGWAGDADLVGRARASLAETLCDGKRAAEGLVLLAPKPAGGASLESTRLLYIEGRCKLAVGQAGAAIDPLERAVAARVAGAAGPRALARSRLALGRALWQAGGDRDRARRLVNQAREALAGAGVRAEKDLSEVDAWLIAH